MYLTVLNQDGLTPLPKICATPVGRSALLTVFRQSREPISTDASGSGQFQSKRDTQHSCFPRRARVATDLKQISCDWAMALALRIEPNIEWFACGHSPLCVEVDRLIRSGVVVVVAAGNSGYGFVQSGQQGVVPAGQDLTINDPGNADLAITVGSTHRDMPHTYGVSYFSSKGPTGDGRMKPDLLAPGEKIVSCASGQMKWKAPRPPAKKTTKRRRAFYREDSGTSMAAPHVSGVIAAFLSIRREFLTHPDEVKRIFLSTATDLNRAPYFQGRGLVDAMRAIQSV
jgi:serine protease AprX